MRFKSTLMLAGAVALPAAACAPVDPGFGEALRYDMAIQTVNPDPVYPEDGAEPGSSGVLAQKATERYRKGQTKSVQATGTSSGSGSGSGSGNR